MEIILVVIAAIVAGYLMYRAIEWQALASHAGRERYEKFVSDQRTQRAERKRQAEWKRYARMTADRFAREMQSRDAAIDRHADKAQRLYDQAERHEASSFQIPLFSTWYVVHLRKLADRHVEIGTAGHDEMLRIQALMKEIEAAREIQQRQQAKANFIYLLKLLESENSAAAATALSQIYKLRNSVNWFDLIPSELPAALRDQAAKFLAIAAGTLSLNEARTAIVKLRKLFIEANISWERMAA